MGRASKGYRRVSGPGAEARNPRPTATEVTRTTTDAPTHFQRGASRYPLLARITCADVPLPYAPTLIEASLPNVGRVVKAVKEVTYAKV